MVCSILASTSVLAVWVDGGQWNYGVDGQEILVILIIYILLALIQQLLKMEINSLRIVQKLRHGLGLQSSNSHQREWNISMDLSKILPSPIWRGKTVVEALL